MFTTDTAITPEILAAERVWARWQTALTTDPLLDFAFWAPGARDPRTPAVFVGGA